MKAGRYIRTMPEEDQAKLFDLLVEQGMLDDYFHTTELGEQYIASGELPNPLIQEDDFPDPDKFYAEKEKEFLRNLESEEAEREEQEWFDAHDETHDEED